MALPVYIHTLTVGETTVSPAVPLNCGTEGDDKAARLLLQLENPEGDFAYRLEVVTGGGAYDITEKLELEDGALTFDIPSAWTAAGIAAVRLIRCIEQEDGTETARQYYPPFFLRFAFREEGTQMGDPQLNWQKMLSRAEVVLNEASAKAEQAAQDADRAESVVNLAVESARQAEQFSAEAASNADAAKSAAQEAAEAANGAIEYCQAIVGVTDEIKAIVGV